MSGKISVSRFNRRLHKLADWFELILAVLSELHCKGDPFVIDSSPNSKHPKQLWPQQVYLRQN